MTIQTTDQPAARSLLDRIGGMINSMIEVCYETSELGRCGREAERLFALSDEELARRGLTRDRIVHHAFRRYLYL